MNFDTSVSSVHYQEPYELSQDLVAKQLELLEKKYGALQRPMRLPLPSQEPLEGQFNTYFLLILFLEFLEFTFW